MSFYDLESQSLHKQNGITTHDDTLIALGNFTQDIHVFKKQVSLLGTMKDSEELRHNIESELLPRCEEIKNSLQQMPQILANDKCQKDLKSLGDELKKTKQRYQQLKLEIPVKQSSFEKGEQVNIPNSGTNYASISISNNETTPLLNHEQKQITIKDINSALSQEELDFHSLIQQERSHEISKIHSAVQEVNSIFQQLGKLVNEQNEQVNLIDDNINGLNSNLSKASKELHEADKYQQKKNRCGMLILIVIMVFTLIILLSVVG